jgi:hypothetical protein
MKIYLTIIFVVFFGCVSFEAETPMRYLNLKIYNFSVSGSTNISNVGLLYGEDTTKQKYPYEIESNGGDFELVVQADINDTISGFLVLAIQGKGLFTFNFYSSSCSQYVDFGKSYVRQDGQIQFPFSDMIWRFETNYQEDSYNIVIIINDILD